MRRRGLSLGNGEEERKVNNLTNRELPDWAINMTDDKWEKEKSEYKSLDNCTECGKRLLLTLCNYGSPHYCVEHCPKHEWQSDYDWGTECKFCGVDYTGYLEALLEKHGVEY